MLKNQLYMTWFVTSCIVAIFIGMVGGMENAIGANATPFE